MCNFTNFFGNDLFIFFRTEKIQKLTPKQLARKAELEKKRQEKEKLKEEAKQAKEAERLKKEMEKTKEKEVCMAFIL